LVRLRASITGATAAPPAVTYFGACEGAEWPFSAWSKRPTVRWYAILKAAASSIRAFAHPDQAIVPRIRSS
jgi:hypothetical protein